MFQSLCPEGSLYGGIRMCVRKTAVWMCTVVGGACACGLRNDLCIGGVKKGNIMDTKKKCAKSSSMAGQPSVDSKNEYRNGGVVTQLTPDDLMTDESFRRSGNKADGTPTDQQLNQEVTAINPSVESMDGRG